MFIVCKFLFVSVFELQHSNISVYICGTENLEAVYRISPFMPSDRSLFRLVSFVYLKKLEIEKYGIHNKLTSHTWKNL